MHLITGGAGFIGANLAAALDKDGEDIVVADRLGSGDKWRNIAKRRLKDIVLPEKCLPFLDGARGKIASVIHMGAISTTTETDADVIVENNFKFSLDLWKFCAQERIPFIYASSAATYGDGVAGFADSNDNSYLDKLRPLNPYGWSKHIFDRWALREVERGEASPPRWAGLKFFNVYGPNEYHKAGQRSVAVQFFEQIKRNGQVRLFRSDRPDIADGAQRRDFVWVGDCVNIVLWALRDLKASNGIYNAGSGMPRTFRELADITFSVLGMKPNIEYIDLPDILRGKYQYYTCASLEKLRAAGYSTPTSTLEEGIRMYVKDYLLTSDPYC